MDTQPGRLDTASTGSPATYELVSSGVEATQRLGEQLGRLVVPGDVVLLQGDLGSGKTAFTQGIGCGLGVAEIINSPTFTILKEYTGRLPLYHFDLYRIDDPEELLALGFDEYFADDGVCVVEWAERGESRTDGGSAPWSPSWLRIEFRKTADSERILRCSAEGQRGHALATEFVRAATLGQAG